MNTSVITKKMGLDDFPTLFSRHWFDEVVPSIVDDFFATPRATFPYDVVDHTDDNGNVVSTELVFAVGGIGKEDIDLKIRGNSLCLNINKTDEPTKNKVVRHKGISRRSMSVDYGLYGVDAEKISAKLQNGELRITLPKKEISESVIEIKD